MGGAGDVGVGARNGRGRVVVLGLGFVQAYDGVFMVGMVLLPFVGCGSDSVLLHCRIQPRVLGRCFAERPWV